MSLESQKSIFRVSGRTIYALIAFACPVIAFAAINVYQSYAHAHFWNSVNGVEGDYSIAVGIMALAEFVAIVFYTVVGCFVGLIPAFLSFRLQRKFVGLGLVALVLNAVPVIIFVGGYLYLRFRAD